MCLKPAEESGEYDTVLCAIGRYADLDGLNLASVGKVVSLLVPRLTLVYTPIITIHTPYNYTHLLYTLSKVTWW